MTAPTAALELLLKVKDFKQAGGRLVGYLCSYTPLEVIDAAGASAVGLSCTCRRVAPERTSARDGTRRSSPSRRPSSGSTAFG